jgi:hypothetical protein
MLKFAIHLVSFFVTLAMISLTPHFASAQVWTDTNTWSPEWEARFTEWVQKNWSADFFSRSHSVNGQNNPYYGLRMDCADTVYSMRIIFSYENSLPFAMQDPTTTGRLITNRMTRFNGQSDELQRFRSFLKSMYNVVSTHTLPNDTFPVPVSRDWIHAGGLIRTTEVNHHSWTIQDILPIGVPHLIFNSRVGATSGYGLQQRTSWPNPSWVFEGDFSPASAAGFRYWRPIEYLNKPVWQVPNYSEEQYRIPLGKWQKTVQQKLAMSAESDEQMIHRLYQTACDGMKTRIDAVNDGIAYLRSLPAEQCMDYATYDNYSTPNRDQRVFDDLAALRRAYKDIMKTNGGSTLSEESKMILNKLYPHINHSAAGENSRMSVSRDTMICPIAYANGKKIDLAEAKRRLFAGLMSNNPLDEINYRWGEVKGPSPRAQSCPSWDAWSPDLKQAD